MIIAELLVTVLIANELGGIDVDQFIKWNWTTTG
jgi:hypothetical protein